MMDILVFKKFIIISIFKVKILYTFYPLIKQNEKEIYMRVKIEYIHHSCYTLEIENNFLIFDYFEGHLNIPKDKNVYFFVSHAHGDHYSSKIFDYKEKVKKYIISKDVRCNEDNVVFVKHDENIKVDEMEITTLNSTDAGVAFMINILGKNIFFAGDLNDWYWEMEDSIMQKNDMHARFVREIDKIKNIKMDIAFFLVDPRQAGQYDLGGKQILQLKPKNFLPMHFWEDYSITTKFKDVYTPIYKDTTIYDIQNKNQIIELDI